MKQDLSLIGVGLYTTAEAGRLTGIPSQRLLRWTRGHTVGDTEYPRLWKPQVKLPDNDTVFLGFLDLVQARVADGFIAAGLSAQKVRRAIEYGREIINVDYPFASARFRTDGKTVVLHVLSEDGDENNDKLIDLFRSGQYLMQKVIEPSLKGLEFEDDFAARWWPLGKQKKIVIDPKRQFGQPIDDETGVPTVVLAHAAVAEGSAEAAAQAFMVPVTSVRRAVAYEQRLAA